MERDITSVPNALPGNGDNNKAIPKVSAVKPTDPKPRVQEENLEEINQSDNTKQRNTLIFFHPH